MGGSPSSVKEDRLLNLVFSRRAPSGLVCISRAWVPARALFQLGTPQHPRGLLVSTGGDGGVPHLSIHLCLLIMISEDLRHTAETDMDQSGHPTDEHVVLVDLVTVLESDIRRVPAIPALRFHTECQWSFFRLHEAERHVSEQYLASALTVGSKDSPHSAQYFIQEYLHQRFAAYALRIADIPDRCNHTSHPSHSIVSSSERSSEQRARGKRPLWFSQMGINV